MYRTVIIPAIFALGFTLAGTTHPTAVAGPTPQVTINARYPCGYDGYYGGEQPLYNHCGRSDVGIRVHHFFWQTTYDCVAPGVHQLDQGDSQWRIISAEYDGHGCKMPGPVVGP